MAPEANGHDANKYPIEAQGDRKRLAQQHEPIVQSMGGRAVLAPIDLTLDGLQVLDSGTSDGYWLLDLRKNYPNLKTLVGTDIDTSRFPEKTEEDLELHKQDCTQAWPEEWKGRFDLVHQRLVLAAARNDPRTPVMMLADLVKPGGWIQLIEADNTPGPKDGPAYRSWLQIIKALFAMMGVPPGFSRNMATWLEEAGFVKVGSMLAPYSFGAQCPQPQLRQATVDSAMVAATDIIVAAKNMNLDFITKKELETLPDRLRAELHEVGGYFPLKVVWGQKPY